MKRKTPEYIEFEDHSCASGWMQEHTVLAPTAPLCCAIGWIIHEDNHRLCIAGVTDSDGKDSTVRQYIVKSCIVKRKKVKLPWTCRHEAQDPDLWAAR